LYLCRKIYRMRIFPEKIKKGDTVALIAPAGNLSAEKLQKAIDNIERMGCKPIYRDDILASYGYLAGNDQRRIDELHQMVANTNVKAIFCARGGYGLTRILGRIDYELIRQNPKPIVGYSDVTALINSIFQKTGLIGFHSPVASATITQFAHSGWQQVLFEGKSNILIEAKSNDDSIENYETVYSICGGKVEGWLAGGNLSLIAAMVGTEFEIDFDDKIVLIEDVGEEPYRIDRMLTQLLESGSLDMAKGIVCGRFSGCHPSEPERSLTLKEVLTDRLSVLEIPVFVGLPFGHIDDNFTLPIGALAEMNADDGTLRLVESGVNQ